MPSQYIPILIVAILAVTIPIASLLVMKGVLPGSHITGAIPEPSGDGNHVEDTARGEYFGRFYVVAILFALLDVAIVFLFSWAIKFSQMGGYGFVVMAIFLASLLAGLAWVYKKGALDWT
jgi:NADH-quinone oxidoreductase subunit A